jgi:hypothetical protein
MIEPDNELINDPERVLAIVPPDRHPNGGRLQRLTLLCGVSGGARDQGLAPFLFSKIQALAQPEFGQIAKFGAFSIQIFKVDSFEENRESGSRLESFVI